jgi:hypothetical protein
MKKATKGQAKEIRALKRMKDEDIDLSDIPATARLEQSGYWKILPSHLEASDYANRRRRSCVAQATGKRIPDSNQWPAAKCDERWPCWRSQIPLTVHTASTPQTAAG